MKPFRAALFAVAVLAVSSGCNTCLDPTSVPLRGEDSGTSPDGGSPGDMGPLPDLDAGGGVDADAGPGDVGGGDDGGNADMGTCVPETDEELCARFDRACGRATGRDRCGDERTVNCDSCDPDRSTCDPENAMCACFDGWRSVDRGTRCVDIDECDEGTDNCADGTNCTNLPGDFQCSTCPSGFLDVNGDGTECVDIDECENGSANCDPLAECINEEGSYRCGDCADGYKDVNGDGTQCDDVDECQGGLDDCDVNASCVNVPGSWECNCNDGYSGPGDVCTDIDECALDRDNCDTNAECINEPGSFSCSCVRGFTGDGTTCTPVPLVTQVDIITKRIDNTDEIQTVGLSGVWDVANTVPFVSAAVPDGDPDGDFGRSLHVYLQGPDTLVVERPQDGYDVTFSVALVEFNPDAVTVQSGTWTMDGLDTIVALPSTVDTSRSFLQFNGAVAGLPNLGKESARGRLNPSSVEFDRDSGDGTFDGHWWVVETTRHFSVEAATVSIGANQTCANTSIGSVADNRTFLLWSNRYAGSEAFADANLGCALSGNGVECCRGDAGSGTSTASVFAVQFSDAVDGLVEFGKLNLPDQTQDDRVALSTAAGPFATAILGQGGMSGSIPVVSAPGLDASDAMAAVRLEGAGTEVEARRGDFDGEATVYWQVVHWPN